MADLDHEFRDVFVDALGFDRDDERTVYGSYRDYPVAVSLADSEGGKFLLIHVRHTRDADALPPRGSMRWGPTVDKLCSDGNGDVSIESRIAWLTVFRLPVNAPNGVSRLILDEMLDQLSANGFSSPAGTCHYCGRNTVKELTFAEGRVAQICNNCLADREAAKRNENEVTSGLLPAALLCVPGTIVAAVLWTATWLLRDWIVGLVANGREYIYVPHIVSIAWFLVVGFVVAYPVRWIIRRVPELGTRYARMLGVVSAVVAMLIGEFLECAFLIYRVSGRVAPVGAASLLPTFWRTASVPHLLEMAAAAVIVISVAYHSVRERNASLRL